MPHAGGRPLAFSSVEELQTSIDKYFTETPAKEITITGLALHLDVCRETLVNYQHKPEYFRTIKRAKDKVALEYEKDLRKQGRSGDIFALKNFGWRDKQEIEHSGNLTLSGLIHDVNNAERRDTTEAGDTPEMEK